MPPGIRHPNHVCWDDLETPQHAKLIGFYQTVQYDKSGAGQKSPKPKPRPK